MDTNMGITADMVRTMRENTGRGMMECKLILQKRNAAKIIAEAETLDDIKPVLTWLVESAR